MANIPKTEIALRAAASAVACGLCAYLLIARHIGRPPQTGESLPDALERLDRAQTLGYFDATPSETKAQLLLQQARTASGDGRRALLTMAYDELGGAIRAQPLNGRAWALRLWLEQRLWPEVPAPSATP